MARAALSQGRRNVFAGQVQISRQAQRFRKVRYRLRSRRSTFARCGPDFVAGTILSEGQVQISQQARHFCKVRDRFAAGAILSQGAVQISRFRKRCQFRGRRSTFARYGAEFLFDAGAALNQRGGLGGAAGGSEDSTRGALSSVSILQISRGVGGGCRPPHDVRRSGDSPKMMIEEAMIQQRVR